MNNLNPHFAKSGLLVFVICLGCGSDPKTSKNKTQQAPKIQKHDWTELAKDTSPDIFTSAIAKIQVRKPKGWRFVPSEEIKKLRQSLKLHPDLGDATNMMMPVVSVMKYEENHSGINPVAGFGVRPNIPALKGMTVVEILSKVISDLPKRTKDFKLITPPEKRLIDGEEAAYAVYSLKHEYKNGASLHGITRFYYIRKSKNTVIISMVGAVTGPDRSDKEFSEILQSIKIGR